MSELESRGVLENRRIGPTKTLLECNKEKEPQSFGEERKQLHASGHTGEQLEIEGFGGWWAQWVG